MSHRIHNSFTRAQRTSYEILFNVECCYKLLENHSVNCKYLSYLCESSVSIQTHEMHIIYSYVMLAKRNAIKTTIVTWLSHLLNVPLKNYALKTFAVRLIRTHPGIISVLFNLHRCQTGTRKNGSNIMSHTVPRFLVRILLIWAWTIKFASLLDSWTDTVKNECNNVMPLLCHRFGIT